jgi:uncharacterized repeat protein (TIGR02543 family)
VDYQPPESGSLEIAFVKSGYTSDVCSDSGFNLYPRNAYTGPVSGGAEMNFSQSYTPPSVITFNFNGFQGYVPPENNNAEVNFTTAYIAPSSDATVMNLVGAQKESEETSSDNELTAVFPMPEMSVQMRYVEIECEFPMPEISIQMRYVEIDCEIPSFSMTGEGDSFEKVTTGTITSADESDIVSGGKTIVLTLPGKTWVSTVGEDNAITDALISGIESAQSEANGWNAVVKANMDHNDIVRTSDTVVTITLSAESSYDITVDETITVTIPSSAIDGGGDAVIEEDAFSIAFTPHYSVTYDSNESTTGSVPVDSDEYAAGETVTVLGNINSLARFGYTFGGWNTESDGSGILYAESETFSMGSEDITLYATWNIVKMSRPAKSVVIDIADNWGNTNGINVRQIDFWNNGSKITNVETTNFTADATTDFASWYDAALAFDTSLNKIGDAGWNSWESNDEEIINQRLICVFNTVTDFDEIRVVNGHSSGSMTDAGAKNVVINTSSDTITSTTYNDTITNSNLAFDGQFDQHSSVDEEDEQILILNLWPQVDTDEATSLLHNAATLNGTLLNSDGEATNLDVFFEYGETTSYGTETTQETLTELTSFDADISGLDAVTIYHFRAVVTDGVDFWYGEDQTFTTFGVPGVFCDLPSMSAALEGHGVDVVDIDLPSLSLEIVNIDTGVLSCSVPNLYTQFNGEVSYEIEALRAEFPDFNIKMDCGGSIKSSQLPCFSMDAEGDNNYPGSLRSRFSSFSFSMRAGGQVLTSFPPLNMEMEATPTLPASLSVLFHELSMNCFTGGEAAVEFPALELITSVSIGHIGRVEGELPVFNIEGYAGCYSQIELPAFISAMEASADIIATISVSLPSLRTSSAAILSIQGNIDITVPKLKAKIGMVTGEVGELNNHFPMFRMSGVTLPGLTGTINGNLGIMEMAISANPSGPGDICAVLPIPKMQILSGAVDSGVLRYVKERLR